MQTFHISRISLPPSRLKRPSTRMYDSIAQIVVFVTKGTVYREVLASRNISRCNSFVQCVYNVCTASSLPSKEYSLQLHGMESLHRTCDVLSTTANSESLPHWTCSGYCSDGSQRRSTESREQVRIAATVKNDENGYCMKALA